MKNETKPQSRKTNADLERNTKSQDPCPRKSWSIQFQELRIGQFFEYRGRLFQKIALKMARDEDGNGSIFHAQTEVLPDPLGRPA